MPHLRDFVIDVWSTLSHKKPLSDDPSAPGPDYMAPTWVGPDHRRRLQAYAVLSAYLHNVARQFLATFDREDRREHREYGDAALLVKATRAAVLGETIVIIVDGADEDLPDDATAEDKKAAADAGLRQEWFDSWTDDEQFAQKVIETEDRAIGLGDGVYLVAWSGEKRRPRVRIYDPGFYFPVLDPSSPEDDFPERVHLAWQYERVNSRGVTEQFVERITFELSRITVAIGDDGNPLLDEDDGITLRDGDRFDDEGDIVRDLPWNDEPTPITCYMTHAVWPLSELGSRFVDDFDPTKATYQLNDEGEVIRRLDLGIDYLPVVHIPNTVNLLEHYGESLLASVAQILDDIAMADTDLAKAARTTGVPPLAVKGAEGSQLRSYGPGTVLNGEVSVVDTANSLTALSAYLEALLKRLSDNARIPQAILGRIDPGEIEAGIILALSFSPFQRLIDEMRLVRRAKYRLVTKFVQRFALLAPQAGVMDDDRFDADAGVLDANLNFGAFLPSDLPGVVSVITGLLDAGAISRRTALQMLVDAGLIIDGTIDEELARIDAEDLERLAQLLDITDDVNLVREMLGLEPLEEVPEPAPEPTPP